MFVPPPREEAITEPRPVVPPLKPWSATVARARDSLNQLWRSGVSGGTLESLASQVAGQMPAARREAAMPRIVGWIRVRKAGEVSLKLRKVGWQHLVATMDPNRQVLVLTYGANADHDSERWLLNLCPKSQIPPKAVQQSCILRFRELVVFIPQKEHLPALNGKVLVATGAELSIE